MARQEIERKFRLHKKPRLARVKGSVILQGYLITANGELRVRKRGKKHFITVKSDGTRDRNEWEKRTPQWVFELLWPHTVGRRVEKTRYEWDIDGATAAIDVYGGVLEGLIILEVEFTSKRAAGSFALRGNLRTAVEVTDDSQYKNRALATSSVPPWPPSP